MSAAGWPAGGTWTATSSRCAHLQALHEAGHEVGCHTFGHTSVLRMDAEPLGLSLDRQRRLGGRAAGRASDDDLRLAVRDCDPGRQARWCASGSPWGAGCATGSTPGARTGPLIKTIGLESRRLPDYDLEALMAETAASKGWLNAYGHDVSDRPTDYGCTPDDLDRVLRAAKAAGLEVLPVGAAWGVVQTDLILPPFRAKVGGEAARMGVFPGERSPGGVRIRRPPSVSLREPPSPEMAEGRYAA